MLLFISEDNLYHVLLFVPLSHTLCLINPLLEGGLVYKTCEVCVVNVYVVNVYVVNVYVVNVYVVNVYVVNVYVVNVTFTSKVGRTLPRSTRAVAYGRGSSSHP